MATWFIAGKGAEEIYKDVHRIFLRKMSYTETAEFVDVGREKE